VRVSNNVIDVNIIEKATRKKVKRVKVVESDEPEMAVKGEGDQIAVFNEPAKVDAGARPQAAVDLNEVKKKRKARIEEQGGAESSQGEAPPAAEELQLPAVNGETTEGAGGRETEETQGTAGKAKKQTQNKAGGGAQQPEVTTPEEEIAQPPAATVQKGKKTEEAAGQAANQKKKQGASGSPSVERKDSDESGQKKKRKQNAGAQSQQKQRKQSAGQAAPQGKAKKGGRDKGNRQCDPAERKC
jgi:hypothetical protein